MQRPAGISVSTSASAARKTVGGITKSFCECLSKARKTVAQMNACESVAMSVRKTGMLTL